METPRDTEAKTILDAGIKLATGKVITNPNPESPAFVLVPEDHHIEYLAAELLPVRKKGIIKLDDCLSFVRFFNTSDANGTKAIYASLDPLKFVGILNDHTPFSDVPDENDGANWRDFGCSYIPTFSKAWKSTRTGPSFMGLATSRFQLARSAWMETPAPRVSPGRSAARNSLALNLTPNT